MALMSEERDSSHRSVNSDFAAEQLHQVVISELNERG